MLHGSLNGRRVWGRMNTDICMAESLCCLTETYITLLIGYTPIKIKLKKNSENCSVVSYSLQSQGLYSPWNSPGQNTGVGSLSLLQGFFPTQESNWGLLHCRWILYQLSHKGSARILEWVPNPFSRGSSPSSNRTGDSCIAGGLFTS